MAKIFGRLDQLGFAQLLDHALDRSPSRYPANGSFVQCRRNNAAYWYYQGYEKPADGSPGSRTRIYVGPVGDAEAEAARRDHEVRHERYRESRRIAAQLRRAGLPSPTVFDGAVLSALWSAGLFDAGAVLVGSMAYQTYSGLLGVRLDEALMQTGDIDLAQARQVVLSAGTGVTRLQEALRQVDPTFAPILDPMHPTAFRGYVNRRGYKIEFLTSSGRSSASAGLIALRGLDGVAAQPIRFLEFLLEQPVRSIVLHDDGIPVVVPDPARYGVHKLIVATMREDVSRQRGGPASDHAKIAKDIAQAAALIGAMAQVNAQARIGAAWDEAWRRGRGWRDRLRRGASRLDRDIEGLLEEIVLSTIGPAAWPN